MKKTVMQSTLEIIRAKPEITETALLEELPLWNRSISRGVNGRLLASLRKLLKSKVIKPVVKYTGKQYEICFVPIFKKHTDHCYECERRGYGGTAPSDCSPHVGSNCDCGCWCHTSWSMRSYEVIPSSVSSLARLGEQGHIKQCNYWQSFLKTRYGILVCWSD